MSEQTVPPSTGIGRELDRNLPRRLRPLLSLEDFEPAARRRLPRPIFGYYATSAEDNASFADNRAAFAEWGFVPRVLNDVAARSQAATLFGRTWAAPFGIAPMGLSAMATYRGDLVLARAAHAAGIPMVVSGSSLIRLEDLAAASPSAWFQAYLPGEESRILALVDRVARAGFGTLVLTVDTAVLGNRENNIRRGFSSPLRPSLRLAWYGITRPEWLWATMGRTLLRHGVPHFENAFAERGAPIIARSVVRDFGSRGHLNWRHVAMIRERWRGGLVIKGIMHPDDTRLAREHGVDGVIVSNHGGRQLDGTVSPLRVLPGIAAMADGMTVLMDSGIRRGTDVLKALALGASFVFVGRPFLFAAAVAGEAGVRHGIAILKEEIDRDMGLLGINTLAEMRPECLMRLRPSA